MSTSITARAAGPRRARRHERRRPADDSEQMVIRRDGQALDRPQLRGLVCMVAGRREFRDMRPAVARVQRQQQDQGH